MARDDGGERKYPRDGRDARRELSPAKTGNDVSEKRLLAAMEILRDLELKRDSIKFDSLKF